MKEGAKPCRLFSRCMRARHARALGLLVQHALEVVRRGLELAGGGGLHDAQPATDVVLREQKGTEEGIFLRGKNKKEAGASSIVLESTGKRPHLPLHVIRRSFDRRVENVGRLHRDRLRRPRPRPDSRSGRGGRCLQYSTDSDGAPGAPPPPSLL